MASSETTSECRCLCGRTRDSSKEDAAEEGNGTPKEPGPASRRADARRPRCAASVVRWAAPRSPWPLLVLLVLLATTRIAGVGGLYEAAINSPKNGVCQSIDVRNNVTELSRLDGCRVVEGFVQIILIDESNHMSYANYVFPNLVEITGYLLMYRVQGLKSIGQLFPNLTVIRGHQTIKNYALVAFEMTSLQEIGLHSLTDITRGSVRFEKNSLLCYTDTIDWDLIARAGKGEHFIWGNKPKNECPVCSKDCPLRATAPKGNLCWDKQYCQQVCPNCREGVACMANGDCCDESCLGGCTGPSASECKVCRGFVVNGTLCVDSCPAGTYEYLNRRCVTETECFQMRRPLELGQSGKSNPYKPFAGKCIIDCPAGFEEVMINGSQSCQKCNGPCFKECPGLPVDSLDAAQRYRGCTFISGDLEILIREGKNVVKELEASLSGIEVITGYLKIFRSYPIMSLNFLKNLTEIRGKTLDRNAFSLVIVDNQNLQELWDWKNRPPLSIKSSRGTPKVSIHFNPKLCPQLIETLREKTGLEQFREEEVSMSSNGDKVACNVTEINTYVQGLTSKAAIIVWEPFRHHDMRTLLGYIIFYKKAPHQNVSMYESRDACGGDGWIIHDVDAANIENYESEQTPKQKIGEPKAEPKQLREIVPDLDPFTQYVYYVKTYTISTERSGAQSKLVYFKTKPGVPTAVRRLLTYSNSSDSLVISWLPPSQPNSELTHYRIVGKLDDYDIEYLKQRNYCIEPMQPQEPKTVKDILAEEKMRAEQEIEANKPKTDPSSCACPGKTHAIQSETDAYSSIAFENALHNKVYVKRIPTRFRRDTTSFMLEAVRYKRAMSSYQDKDVMSDAKKTMSDLDTKVVTTGDNGLKIIRNIVNDVVVEFEYDVPASTLSLVIDKLRHYGKYNIKVQACRNKTENPLENECSPEAMSTPQTMMLENADDIPSSSFRFGKLPGNDSSSVKLIWEEPRKPNGIIVTYQIEYKMVDVPNNKLPECTPRDKFVEDGFSYVLRNLPPGNYSVRVRAVSFAGYGAFTAPLYFYVPDLNLSTPIWKAVMIMFLVLLVVISAALMMAFIFKKKFMRNVPSMRLIATVNPEYVSTAYIPDEWEVPRKKIQLLKELGNGSFGMVYEGIARDVIKGNPEMPCAVKTVNENATDRERIEFLNEASVMKGFKTNHVVRLLGVVSQGQPTLVVMELMTNGDLKTYLRSHRPDVCENFSQQPPTLKRILQMAAEIADGMAYLAAKKFVHRDLAARNCMVAEDLTVKIGDFGMTRDVYETDYYRKGTKGLLPVRWMAPESLKDGVFTSFSDVWSYGVVLWEMVTLASQPYQGLSNDQVLRYVKDGGVMERPENCPDSLYILMRQTWNHKATRRPTFIDIATMLLSEIDVESFEKVSFYHSPEGIEARNQNNSQFLRSDKDLELVTLQDLREEEPEGEEDSPLRQDFGEFSSFEPMTSIKNGSSGHFGMEPFNDNSKSAVVGIGFLDLDSSKAPLKAGFDDFDGVSAGSLASSKDTLDLPFAEDSVKSVRGSPYAQKKSSSRGNVSQSSAGRSSLSPHSPSIVGASTNPGSRASPSVMSGSRSDPEYENRSPECANQRPQQQQTATSTPSRDVTGLRMSFPSIDDADSEPTLLVASVGAAEAVSASAPPSPLHPEGNSSSGLQPQQAQAAGKQLGPAKANSEQHPLQQLREQPQPLNNGYIGGATTT